MPLVNLGSHTDSQSRNPAVSWDEKSSSDSAVWRCLPRQQWPARWLGLERASVQLCVGQKMTTGKLYSTDVLLESAGGKQKNTLEFVFKASCIIFISKWIIPTLPGCLWPRDPISFYIARIEKKISDEGDQVSYQIEITDANWIPHAITVENCCSLPYRDVIHMHPSLEHPNSLLWEKWCCRRSIFAGRQAGLPNFSCDMQLPFSKWSRI